MGQQIPRLTAMNCPLASILCVVQNPRNSGTKSRVSDNIIRVALGADLCDMSTHQPTENREDSARRGKPGEEAWCFGLCVAGPTGRFCVIIFLRARPEMCIRTVRGPRVRTLAGGVAVTVGHGVWWDYSSVVDRQGQSVVLAMYTFVVGPWLPQTSVISSGLKHTPGRTRQKHSCNMYTEFLI